MRSSTSLLLQNDVTTSLWCDDDILLCRVLAGKCWSQRTYLCSVFENYSPVNCNTFLKCFLALDRYVKSIHLQWCTLEKNCYTPFKAIKSIWIKLVCFQWVEFDITCTSGCSPTWSFLQICLRTVASSNQQLPIFFLDSYSLPNPLGIGGGGGGGVCVCVCGGGGGGIQQGRIISAQGLTAWIGNLYGMRAG